MVKVLVRRRVMLSLIVDGFLLDVEMKMWGSGVWCLKLVYGWTLLRGERERS
jgi:hypothetical protein